MSELSAVIPVEKSIAPRLLAFAQALEVLFTVVGAINGIATGIALGASVHALLGVVAFIVCCIVGWIAGIVASASLRWMAEVIQTLIAIRAAVER